MRHSFLLLINEFGVKSRQFILSLGLLSPVDAKQVVSIFTTCGWESVSLKGRMILYGPVYTQNGPPLGHASDDG